MDGFAAGRHDAGPNHAPAEAGRRLCAWRKGGLSVVRADERDSGAGGRRAGDRDGDAAATGGGEGINPYILVAAAEAGVKEMYRVGGAQAVAALAYGTESIAPVDKICGPGNIYVALAKREVYRRGRHRQHRRAERNCRAGRRDGGSGLCRGGPAVAGGA